MEGMAAIAQMALHLGGRNPARNTFVSMGVGSVIFWDVCADSGEREWMVM